VPGTPAADGVSWTSTEKLGYGRTYTVTAEAVDAAGAVATQQYSFTTLTPGAKAATSFFPRDGMTVGVGQPVAVTFDEPITDKAAVEAVTTVTTTPVVEGAFHWLSDTELHWRPRDFWPSNTTVVVAAMIYGRDLGGGVYGREDRTATFTIGQTKVAVVDDATHTMTVTVDGVVVKQMPVSLGRDEYPTYNGVHVVAEKYETKVMDSSTWGLTGADAYRTEVAWATRISSSGEFVHAAPWSVDSQGEENVSHGCVNVSTENARWFHDNFSFGDVVDIRGTVGPPLQVWDGFGDWQVPWETYVQGGARAS
jgi:lipoprotein-anchoring transpeptidase ErfK/SrfK